MADYARAGSGGATHFTDKDALTTGDTDKVIVGSQFDDEFNAVLNAVADKLDEDDWASTAEAKDESSTTKIISPSTLADWSDDHSGMVGDMQGTVDPDADGLWGWDDSAGVGILFTFTDGLAFGDGVITLEHLGFEDLEDAGADRILFWDDGGGATGWLQGTKGVEISGTELKLVDVSAGAAQPVVITDGTFTFDLSSVTTMSIEDVNVAQDGIVMSDNGTVKVLPLDEGGVDVIEHADAIQTFALADANTLQVMTGISADRIWTIPTNADEAFKIGTIIYTSDRDGGVSGANNIGVLGDTGVTVTSVLRSGTANTHQITTGGTAAFIKVATDEWLAVGDIF